MLENVLKMAVALLVAECSDVPPSLSEKAVFIIEEHQVDMVISSLHRVFVSYLPEIVCDISVVLVNFFEFFWNPLTEAFITWPGIEFAHTVETLVASTPDVLCVEVESFDLFIEIYFMCWFRLFLWLMFGFYCWSDCLFLLWLFFFIVVFLFSHNNSNGTSKCESSHLLFLTN